MVISTSVIARGIGLGLGAAVPIGPVNVEIARRTLRGGFFAGFALGCGAVSIDVTYAIVSSLSWAQLLMRRQVLLPVSLGGVVFLMYLGFLSLRGAVRDWRADYLQAAALAPSARGGYLSGAYVTGVLMTLLNPMTLAFWFLAVPGQVASFTKDAGGSLPMICTGVFIGTILWVVTFAGILSRARRWRKTWWIAAADATGGLILFGFALAKLWQVRRLLL